MIKNDLFFKLVSYLMIILLKYTINPFIWAVKVIKNHHQTHTPWRDKYNIKILYGPMILRHSLQVQQNIRGINLLPIPIKNLYSLLHNSFLLGWIIGILFVVILLILLFKFRQWTSKTVVSRSTIETLWLTVPAFILIFIAIPSLLRLYHRDQQSTIEGATIKTVGSQWYWSYELFSNARFRDESFFSRYIDYSSNDRLTYLSSDLELVLPGYEEFTNLISASDVIHCWAIPNLIVKVDAIPGRVNAVSISFDLVDRVKKLYGQCSELCGANHRFMPITLFFQ